MPLMTPRDKAFFWAPPMKSSKWRERARASGAGGTHAGASREAKDEAGALVRGRERARARPSRSPWLHAHDEVVHMRQWWCYCPRPPHSAASTPGRCPGDTRARADRPWRPCRRRNRHAHVKFSVVDLNSEGETLLLQMHHVVRARNGTDNDRAASAWIRPRQRLIGAAREGAKMPVKSAWPRVGWPSRAAAALLACSMGHPCGS